MRVPTHRGVLSMIGKIEGGLAMYQAMTALGHSADSNFTTPAGTYGARGGMPSFTDILTPAADRRRAHAWAAISMAIANP